MVGGRAFFIIAAAATAAACGGSSSVSTPPTPTPTHDIVRVHVTKRSVPLVACPTERGASPKPAAQYKNPFPVVVRKATEHRLAFYSDDARALTPVFAPRGWLCQVRVGKDRSTTLRIFPAHSSPARRLLVAADSAGRCGQCMYDAVCAIVPRAPQILGVTSRTCPIRPTTGEQVSWLSGQPSDSGTYVYDMVRVVDPPGVHGLLPGSGHADPTRGVVLLENFPARGTARIACTLPVRQQLLCAAAIRNFVDQNWLLP
jgi:hypothetical protein